MTHYIQEMCGFFFKKEYTNHNVRRLETSSQEIKWCFNQGEYNTRCTLFPLIEVFSHWVFLARFLMRQQMVRIKRYVYSFSFTRIFSHRVFPSKVLTRHIIYGHPRGSVINPLNCVDCPFAFFMNLSYHVSTFPRWHEPL